MALLQVLVLFDGIGVDRSEGVHLFLQGLHAAAQFLRLDIERFFQGALRRQAEFAQDGLLAVLQGHLDPGGQHVELVNLLLLAVAPARKLAPLRLELLACGHLLHAHAVEAALRSLCRIERILPVLRGMLELLQALLAFLSAGLELLLFLLELFQRLFAALLLLAVERHLLGTALPLLLEHGALQGFFLHALAERCGVLLGILEVEAALLGLFLRRFERVCQCLDRARLQDALVLVLGKGRLALGVSREEFLHGLLLRSEVLLQPLKAHAQFRAFDALLLHEGKCVCLALLRLGCTRGGFSDGLFPIIELLLAGDELLAQSLDLTAAIEEARLFARAAAARQRTARREEFALSVTMRRR